jgi:hypothetical protein
MDFDGFPVELITLYIYIKIDEILSPILPKIGFEGSRNIKIKSLKRSTVSKYMKIIF